MINGTMQITPWINRIPQPLTLEARAESRKRDFFFSSNLQVTAGRQQDFLRLRGQPRGQASGSLASLMFVQDPNTFMQRERRLLDLKLQGSGSLFISWEVLYIVNQEYCEITFQFKYVQKYSILNCPPCLMHSFSPRNISLSGHLAQYAFQLYLVIFLLIVFL